MDILYDALNGRVLFSGEIGGDVDLNGDGEIDVPTTDKVVDTLRAALLVTRVEDRGTVARAAVVALAVVCVSP